MQTERDWAGNNKFTYHPDYNIPYTDTANGRNERQIKDFPVLERQLMSKIEATLYPPLYYFAPTVLNKILYNSDLFVRVFAVRLMNLVYFIFMIIIVYRLFELVFNNKFISICGTTIFCFHPMFSFTQAGINSDNLYNLLFTAGIYLSLSLLKNGLKIRNIFLAFIIYFLIINTKPQGYLLILIYLFPLVLNLLKKKSLKQIMISTGMLTIIVFPLLLKYFKGHPLIPDVYTNNPLVKNLTFPEHFIWSLKHGYKEVMPWYWGVFRWLSLTLSRVTHRIINRTVMVLIFGLILYITKIIKRKDFSFRTISLSFFIYSTLIYFIAITYWDYLFFISHGYSFGIQGRYFFPTLVSQIGILFFGILGLTSREKIQRIIILILTSSTIGLHEIALFRVLFSYFSTENISKFFIQASQYKPWFFKSPVLEFILLVHLLGIIILICQLGRKAFVYEKK